SLFRCLISKIRQSFRKNREALMVRNRKLGKTLAAGLLSGLLSWFEFVTPVQAQSISEAAGGIMVTGAVTLAGALRLSVQQLVDSEASRRESCPREAVSLRVVSSRRSVPKSF